MDMIYKYFSEGNLPHAFNREGHVGIKCSLPKDYNDPFELFLGVDLDQDTELLATYREVVQEITQILTTCFSKSPVVSPMWAHYANNHNGFVVGFDVSRMQDLFPTVLVRDISYRDRPSDTLIEFAQVAAHRKKPRDAMRLRHAVMYHGYFSKHSEWSYEQEVRAVNLEDYVEDVSGHKIFYIPQQCVGAIISGAKSSDQTRQSLRVFASEFKAEYYIGKIGNSYPTPYLLADNGSPSVVLNGEITPPEGVCGICTEPLRATGEVCPWCAINEEHQFIAASNNPLRVLNNHGLLQEYMEKFPEAPRKPYK